jgi:hypothetical protein
MSGTIGEEDEGGEGEERMKIEKTERQSLEEKVINRSQQVLKVKSVDDQSDAQKQWTNPMKE